MLGEKIREIRKAHQLSQEELALILNVTRKTISRWEIGENRPDRETLERIAAGLNLGHVEINKLMIEAGYGLNQSIDDPPPEKLPAFSEVTAEVIKKEMPKILTDALNKQQEQTIQNARPKTSGNVSYESALQSNYQDASKRKVIDNSKIPPIKSLPNCSRCDFQPNPLFMGREGLTVQIAKSLEVKRGVILYGIGGIGKTQTAIDYCYRYGTFYEGGVFFISCANPDTIDVEVAKCGGIYGLNLKDNFEDFPMESQVALVKKAFQLDIPRLLIFDNVDLNEGTNNDNLISKILDLIPATGGSEIIITSRNNRWASEFGLPIEHIHVNSLSEKVSIDLLREFGNEISDEIASEIAKELGFHPLALYIAGSYLSCHMKFGLWAENFLIELKEKSIFEHNEIEEYVESRSLSGYKENVGRVFAMSCARLSKYEIIDRTALELLNIIASMAPGEPIPFSFLKIWSEYHAIPIKSFVKSIERLCEIGLLYQNESGNENMLTAHRLIVSFTRTIERTPYEIMEIYNVDKITNYVIDADRLKIILPHLETVAEHIQSFHGITSVRWCTELGHYLTYRRHLEFARSLLFWSFEELSSISKTVYHQLEIAEIHSRLAVNFNADYKLEKGYECNIESLRIRKNILNPTNQLLDTNYNNLGFYYLRIGDLKKSREYLDLSWKIKILQSDKKLIWGIYHSNMALVEHFEKNFEKAIELQKTSLKYKHLLIRHREHYVGSSEARLAAIYFDKGDKENGKLYLDKALKSWRRAYGKHSSEVARGFQNLGKLVVDNNMKKSGFQLFKVANGLYQEMFMDSTNPDVKFVKAELEKLTNVD